MADLILIGCVKSKQNCMRVAKDLYNSPLWRYRRAYAEQSGSSWYILSAEHGLLAPETEIEPYDVTLRELSASKRRSWSQYVLDELSKEFSSLKESVIEIHAGKHYVEYGLAQGLRDAGCKCPQTAGRDHRHRAAMQMVSKSIGFEVAAMTKQPSSGRPPGSRFAAIGGNDH